MGSDSLPCTAVLGKPRKEDAHRQLRKAMMPKRKAEATPKRNPDEGCEDIRGAFGRVPPKHRKTEAELQEEEFAKQMQQAMAASTREHQQQREGPGSSDDDITEIDPSAFERSAKKHRKPQHGDPEDCQASCMTN